MNYQRRCIVITNPERDHLSSELWKLQKKLTSLEIDYEAKIKVYKEYDEDKKILKIKKNFTVKRETNVETQKIINKRIDEIDKAEALEQHIIKQREWKKAEGKISNFKPYKEFLKKFIEMWDDLDKNKQNGGSGVSFSEFKYEMIESGYSEEQFQKTFQYMMKDWDIVRVMRYSRDNNSLWSLFTKELRTL